MLNKYSWTQKIWHYFFKKETKSVPVKSQVSSGHWQSGTILIEVMVGLAMVAVALTALVSLALSSINVQLVSKQLQESDQINQECLEAVRQIRDKIGWVVTTDGQEVKWSWSDEGIWNPDGETFFRVYLDQEDLYWRMQRLPNSLHNPLAQDYRLDFDFATGSYGYKEVGNFSDEANTSLFYRQLIIKNWQDDPSLKEVTCNLSWNTRSQKHSTQLSTILTQW